MPNQNIDPAQFDFVKALPTAYFDLLRLAKVTNCPHTSSGNCSSLIETLHHVPEYEVVHKRILPLLHSKALKLKIFDELNANTQQILTNATQQGVVTQLASKKQLSDIVEALSEHNIPIILLKGAAFAEVLYSVQAPRTSNDLDILIHPKDWKNAVNVINGLMTYTEKPQPDVFGDLYELSFLPNNKIGAALDLHSALVHPLLFSISEDQLWDNSVEHPSFKSKLVRMLCSEHALIHQAIHAYKDMNFSKYNLVDSSEIITQQKPDLKKTIAIARSWGASSPLFVLMYNCSDIMYTNISYRLMRKVKPMFVTYRIMDSLLKSRHAQPVGDSKSLRYRVNQVLGQFAFTGSLKRPLALQGAYLRAKFGDKSNRGMGVVTSRPSY